MVALGQVFSKMAGYTESKADTGSYPLQASRRGDKERSVCRENSQRDQLLADKKNPRQQPATGGRVPF